MEINGALMKIYDLVAFSRLATRKEILLRLPSSPTSSILIRNIAKEQNERIRKEARLSGIKNSWNN